VRTIMLWQAGLTSYTRSVLGSNPSTRT